MYVRILPADKLVALVKLDPSPRGQIQKVGFFDEVKRWMLLEKIGDAVVNSGRLQRRSSFVDVARSRACAARR